MQGRGLKLLEPIALANQLWSPLMQGRGLKPSRGHEIDSSSPLMQGRGLKQYTVDSAEEGVSSPLMQGRGLKLGQSDRANALEMSPLMQGRGLKPAINV